MTVTIATPRSKKTNHKRGILIAYRANKQAEAEARQADYAYLSPTQRLARLDHRGGDATRERARIALIHTPKGELNV